MDIMDFEAADDILILLGIGLILFGQLLYGAIFIVGGLIMMFMKGEGGPTPKPMDRKDYNEGDTGPGDFDSDDGGDGDGDDGDGDGDD